MVSGDGFYAHESLLLAWKAASVSEGELAGKEIDKSKHLRYRYDVDKRKYIWETTTLTRYQRFARKLFNSYQSIDNNVMFGFKNHLISQKPTANLFPQDLRNLKGVEKDIYDYMKRVWGASKVDAYLQGNNRIEFK